MNTQGVTDFKPTREQLIDHLGRPLTQALFLEINYYPRALYTFKDVDHVYKDKLHYSIKQLYLNMADPTEYEFANTYFISWPIWKRIVENRLIKDHVESWREELELKLRLEGIKQVALNAKDGSFQAAKWLAERGWENKGAGRPSKSDIEKEKKIQLHIADEYSGDVVRLFGEKSA